MNKPSPENAFQSEHVHCLLESYYQLLGRPLLANREQQAKQLFYAPFAVVSHGTESDPIFNYANQKALELFEYSWQEFTQLPSRLSAEPVNRYQRAQLLDQVSNKGFIDHYQGVRISKTGRRFIIKNAVVWNLTLKDQVNRGQAAFFEHWQYINNVAEC